MSCNSFKNSYLQTIYLQMIPSCVNSMDFYDSLSIHPYHPLLLEDLTIYNQCPQS